MKKSEINYETLEVLRVLNNGGYIKGMGENKYRLMDTTHNPIKNIETQVTNRLNDLELIKVSGIVRIIIDNGIKYLNSQVINNAK